MPILTVDTETKGLSNKFVHGVIINEKFKAWHFNDPNSMFNALVRQIEANAKHEKRTYIYAHNQQFDFSAYAQNFITDPSFSYFLKTFSAIYKDRGYFLDSRKIFPMTLKELGETIGVPKTDMPEALKEGREMSFSEFAMMSQYCENDAIILMKAIKKLKDDLRSLGFKPMRFFSAGQIAVSCYINYLKKRNLWWKLGYNKKIHQTQYYNEIRTAFRGARCQAFRTGKFKNIAYIDVNALYPYIMSTMNFPNLKNEYHLDDVTKDDLMYYNSDPCFVDCTMEVPAIRIGYLPIRYERGIHFPNCKGLKMSSIWTLNEVIEAEKLGYKIRKIRKLIIFPRMKNLFKDYMEMLYNYKMTVNRSEQMLVKLLMNSLFGKFGQKPYKQDARFIDRADLLMLETMYPGYKFAGIYKSKYVITKEFEKLSYFVNPTIPALVTADARDYIYKFLRLIGGDDLLYTDTDSIIMKNFEKYKHLFNISRNLGEWKIVHDNAEISIKGDKVYMINDKPKIAGVPRGFISKQGFEDGVIKHKKMITLLNAIKKNATPGEFIDRESVFTVKDIGLTNIMESEINDYRD